MGDLNDFTKKTLPEMAAAFFTAAIVNLLARDTIRSAITGRVRKLVTGDAERPHPPVPAVEGYADQIVVMLERRNISSGTIGIDGLPGSGKSTLGRYLAKRTGLKWKCLSMRDMREPYFFLPGHIYENIRLFRTQDIDNFDAIVYINCPVEDAQLRVINRDRNGALADYVDFRMLKKIGDAAFAMADGEEIIIPMSPVRIKMRPRGGYKDGDNLRMTLRSRGVDIEGFSKEELLFMHCYGKPKSGILPYVKFGAYNNEILSGAYAALRVASVKKLLS